MQGVTRPWRPKDRFAFDDAGAPPETGDGFAFDQERRLPPALAPSPAPRASTGGSGDTEDILKLLDALLETKRKQADEARGRQFGDVGGLNAAQRAMLSVPGDRASKAAALSSFTAANRRSALRAAGIDPDAPGATGVSATGKTPEQYAADVRRAIQAQEERRLAAAERLRERNADQKLARRAVGAPAVNLATTPEELALLRAMSAA